MNGRLQTRAAIRLWDETHTSMQDKEADPAFHIRDHKSAACFAYASIALFIYGVAALIYQVFA